MRRPTFAALTGAALLCLSTIALAPAAGAAPGNGGSHRNVHVCAAPAAGRASCDAIRDDPAAASGQATSRPAKSRPTKPRAVPPAGYGPADLQSAYALGGLTSGGKTVAIVDAYNAPTAEADLGVYRTQYGLPACTTANGCFTKVNQTGGKSPLPPNDGGWAQEISLDLDMVSAACPDCKILLVEATSPTFANLAAAVNTAASLGPVAISNSYGGIDASSYASSYDHPGIAVTASTGDSGFSVSSPASLPGVIAVGGTSLVRDSSARGWSESAWSGAGSGCSTKNAKPSYQTSDTGCAMKATADVSAVADPNTGVAVYDSFAFQGASGWMEFGGTSASSPIIAGVYALGTADTGSYPAAYTWANADQLNDVAAGSNGTCTTPVWCTSGSGWDGPTGLGTPNGAGAF